MNKELKVGMEVYISYNLRRTNELYTTTQAMEEMKGSKQKIEEVYLDDGGNQLVRICGYSWSSNDIITEEMREQIAKIKFQEFHYDVDQLDI